MSKKDRPILSLAARIHDEGRRLLLEEMKRSGLDELTTSCGDIFQVLFVEDELSLTAVAQRIHRTKSTTCVMIDRLEKLGYVERRPSEVDARASVIALTERGREVRPVIAGVSDRLMTRLLEGLTEAEAETLERLMRKAVLAYGPDVCAGVFID